MDRKILHTQRAPPAAPTNTSDFIEEKCVFLDADGKEYKYDDAALPTDLTALVLRMPRWDSFLDDRRTHTNWWPASPETNIYPRAFGTLHLFSREQQQRLATWRLYTYRMPHVRPSEFLEDHNTKCSGFECIGKNRLSIQFSKSIDPEYARMTYGFTGTFPEAKSCDVRIESAELFTTSSPSSAPDRKWSRVPVHIHTPDQFPLLNFLAPAFGEGKYEVKDGLLQRPTFVFVLCLDCAQDEWARQGGQHKHASDGPAPQPFFRYAVSTEFPATYQNKFPPYLPGNISIPEYRICETRTQPEHIVNTAWVVPREFDVYKVDPVAFGSITLETLATQRQNTIFLCSSALVPYGCNCSGSSVLLSCGDQTHSDYCANPDHREHLMELQIRHVGVDPVYAPVCQAWVITRAVRGGIPAQQIPPRSVHITSRDRFPLLQALQSWPAKNFSKSIEEEGCFDCAICLSCSQTKAYEMHAAHEAKKRRMLALLSG